MPPPAKDAHLYGAPRPSSKKPNKEITSSTNLAFNTALSSLISSTSSSKASTASAATTTTTGRSRPSKQKSDIFTTHNKNTKKRAAADMLAQTHHATQPGEQIADDDWHRAKRQMAEKARLYAAMKRGDVEDEHERYSVDFDSMWAARHPEGIAGEGSEQGGSESESESDSDAGELVDYTDEFGRTRRGTRKEAQRNELAMQRAKKMEEVIEDARARPQAPQNIIYGDTIQADAFTEGAELAAMAAKGRDREPTPPEDKHYDAREEVRTKGTGFFRFSGDEEERREQMERLEKARVETERARGEKGVEVDGEGNTGVGKGISESRQDGGSANKTASEREKERRKKELDERRRLIKEKRGQVQANKFLDSLGEEILGSGNVTGGGE